MRTVQYAAFVLGGLLVTVLALVLYFLLRTI